MVQLQVEVAVREEQTDAVVGGGHLHVRPVGHVEHLVNRESPPVGVSADPASVLLCSQITSIKSVAV